MAVIAPPDRRLGGQRARTSGGLVKIGVIVTQEQDRAIDERAIAGLTSRSTILRQLIDAGLRVTPNPAEGLPDGALSI